MISPVPNILKLSLRVRVRVTDRVTDRVRVRVRLSVRVRFRIRLARQSEDHNPGRVGVQAMHQMHIPTLIRSPSLTSTIGHGTGGQ